MDFKRPRNLFIDDDKMANLQHGTPESPISFIYDEIEKFDQGYIDWHWHPEMEFNVVTDNPIEIFVGDRSVVLKKNEGMWINSGRLHMIKCGEGVSSSLVETIVLSPEFIAHRSSSIYQKYISSWINDKNLSFVTFYDSIDWNRDIVSKIRDVFNMCATDNSVNELAVRNIISDIWLTMTDHRREIPGQFVSRKTMDSQNRIRVMLTFIKENFGNHISLDDIADSAHVSRSECIRCFKKNVDETPVRYLTDFRIKSAANMLTMTEKPVNEIAAKCGFDDMSYFSKIFKNKKGVSPSQFRKEQISV